MPFTLIKEAVLLMDGLLFLRNCGIWQITAEAVSVRIKPFREQSPRKHDRKTERKIDTTWQKFGQIRF